MIIGHGDIANAIIDRDDVIFFASGVSDSRCSDINKFNREERLLLSMPRQQHIVYFGTLSIYYSWTPYIAHKKRMEQVVKDNFQSYTIMRIGNISWGENPNTLINYLKAHPNAEIQEVYRHIIDKDEFQYWISKILAKERNEMNCPGKMVWVPFFAKTLNAIFEDEINEIPKRE